jgi:hypothetical protein
MAGAMGGDEALGMQFFLSTWLPRRLDFEATDTYSLHKQGVY